MWIEWLICAVLYTFQASTPSSGVQTRSTEDLIPCERGWFYFREKCYKLRGKKITGRLNRDQAAEQCRSDGGNLVTIQSKELQEFLVTFLLLDAKTSSWIGLHDRVNESDYAWDDGSIVNYTNWEPEEPSGPQNDEEDCVTLVFKSGRPGGKTGQWNDIPCNRIYAYICETKTSKKSSPDPRFCVGQQGGWKYQNSCYHVVSQKKSWNEAEQHCEVIYNGHLVTILDFTDDIFLEHILSNFNSEVWIGIKIQNKSLQQWTSGWHVSYSEWDKDQGEDIIVGTCSLRSKKKLWRKAQCSKKHSFICESSSAGPPILKQPAKSGVCPEQPENWWDLGGEYCYFIDTQNRFSTYRANLECIRRGGSLVSIHSEAETILLHQFVKYTQNSVFIGLIRLKADEDVFVWTDGSPVDYENWGKDEPNSDFEKCAAAWTSNFKWNDVKCEEEMGYICSMRKVFAASAEKNETSEQCNCPILPNVTKISKQSDCPSGVSLEVLVGVSVCILLVVILIGIVIYCSQRRGEQRNEMSSDIQLQPAVSTSGRPMYKSADIIKDDDGHYEYMN